MNTIHIGIVKFFNVGRLYGFITDETTGKDYFCQYYPRSLKEYHSSVYLHFRKQIGTHF